MPRLDVDFDLRRVLAETRTVAVIGCSPRPARPSHQVAAYLQDAGYTVRPVRPEADEILGERAYPSLTALCEVEMPDLLDVFRRPSALPALVEEALGLGVRRFWFQLGVRHEAAEERLLAAGADLVADRCTLVEHRRLMGDNGR